MNKDNTTEINAETIVPQEKSEAELKIEALEQEKAKLIEEKSNYQVAYLKERQKNKSSDEPEETDEERLRRIVREETANTRLTQIDKEKEDLLKKTLQEVSELKRAQLNRNNVSSAAVSSTEETVKVVDTSITPEQLAAFKKMNWSDKDIERYKKNLSRYRL